MDKRHVGQTTVGTYVKAWWQALPAARRRRWRMAFGVWAVIWLAGAIHAPTAVAGIARLTGLARLLMALGMGGFSFLWRPLTTSGLIQDTVGQPHLLWLILAFIMPGGVGLLLYILSQPPHPLYGIRKMVEGADQGQGRVGVAEVEALLHIEQGIPLVEVPAQEGGWRQAPIPKRFLGLDYARTEGHLLVTAPTRSGKGLHLTDTLRLYPGPALVIDPKGEQYQRTAALRSQWGPIYRVPGHQVHLSGYYRHLRDRDEVLELHYHLLRPWASSEPIFAEKALSLFTAVGLFAQARQGNPLRLLLDLAESDPTTALRALRTVPAARRHIDIFTNGAAPDAYQDDRFVTSALGNFTTRLAPYQKHIDTIAPPDLAQRADIIPPDWAHERATIYITYSVPDLRAVGGVVAAIIAAILRYQVRQGAEAARTRPKMLVAIDELPAVGLRNIADYLATCGGYGITMLLYIQSIAQLQALYGRDGSRAILANCDHQLWYPTAELETAQLMSTLYGTTLKAQPMQSASRSARRHHDGRQSRVQTTDNQGASWSWREGAALSANEMMALPAGQVLATTLVQAAGGLQRKVFLGQRVNSIPLFGQLPAPDQLLIPSPPAGQRTYTDWSRLPAQPETAPTTTDTTATTTTPDTQKAQPPLPDDDGDDGGGPATARTDDQDPPPDAAVAARLLG